MEKRVLIQIKEETRGKLKSLKMYPLLTYDDIIEKMIVIYEKYLKLKDKTNKKKEEKS